MAVPRTLHVVGLLTACLWSLTIHGQSPSPSVQTGVTLPPGDGRDVLVRACNRCHLVTAVISRQRDRTEWSQVVAAMRERGAPVDDGEATAIVDYLSTHFAPGSPAPVTGTGAGGRLFVLGGRVPDTAPVVIGQSLETRPPVGAGQQPAFAGQTRAIAVRTGGPVAATVVASGLRNPWALAFLPDRRMLVTEKPGSMRLVTPTGTISAPIEGVPPVVFRTDAGLLDVVLDPAFPSNRQIYFTYVEPRDGGNGLALARARLRQDDAALEQLTVLLRVEPTRPTNQHYGSRLLFDRDGALFMTVGERAEVAVRVQAQQLDSRLGKVLRLNADGTAAIGNPFATRAGALPDIWSYGHRNSQGLAFHPVTGELWSIEHGEAGGDELNIVRRGRTTGGRSLVTALSTISARSMAGALRLLKWSNRSITGIPPLAP